MLQAAVLWREIYIVKRQSIRYPIYHYDRRAAAIAPVEWLRATERERAVSWNLTKFKLSFTYSFSTPFYWQAVPAGSSLKVLFPHSRVYKKFRFNVNSIRKVLHMKIWNTQLDSSRLTRRRKTCFLMYFIYSCVCVGCVWHTCQVFATNWTHRKWVH